MIPVIGFRSSFNFVCGVTKIQGLQPLVLDFNSTSSGNSTEISNSSLPLTFNETATLNSENETTQSNLTAPETVMLPPPIDQMLDTEMWTQPYCIWKQSCNDVTSRDGFSLTHLCNVYDIPPYEAMVNYNFDVKNLPPSLEQLKYLMEQEAFL